MSGSLMGRMHKSFHQRGYTKLSGSGSYLYDAYNSTSSWAFERHTLSQSSTSCRDGGGITTGIVLSCSRSSSATPAGPLWVFSI